MRALAGIGHYALFGLIAALFALAFVGYGTILFPWRLWREFRTLG